MLTYHYLSQLSYNTAQFDNLRGQFDALGAVILVAYCSEMYIDI